MANGKPLPTAASVQNLHSFASKPKMRQRTMSQTAASVKDQPFRSVRLPVSPVQSCNSDNESVISFNGSQRTRTLRTAASHASLRDKTSRRPLSDTSPPLAATVCEDKPTTRTVTRGGKTNTGQKTQQLNRPAEGETASASPKSTSSSEADSFNEGKNLDQYDTDISSDSSQLDDLNRLLEKERATINVLQRQKEACNKDIEFLSQTVDALTVENQMLKEKYELELLNKTQCKDELKRLNEKLNDAEERLRQQNINEVSLQADRDLIEALKAQLNHSTDQVCVLKATMEQFLRMGIFSDPRVFDIAQRYPTASKAR
ncbi:hypothetical protein EC973_001921 [Apophysomyces ossiformis]|uniref:Uncharacterized protein n=1 Tax=Apophysomyces ossiformis TaxID=679940 RepID=A0A8H7BTU8_9FUNG|nr:hypothetical protein EC973_001921 [Apophysomyces ossiformis]